MKNGKPVIGLDYDETFTLSPAAWAEAMNALRAAGFIIVGATFRYPSEKITDPKYNEVCEAVIYACRNSKRTAARQAGYEVDVWIDDLPAWIDTGVPSERLHVTQADVDSGRVVHPYIQEHPFGHPPPALLIPKAQPIPKPGQGQIVSKGDDDGV